MKFIYTFNNGSATSISWKIYIGNLKALFAGAYLNNKNLETFQYNQHEHLIS